MFGNLFGAKKPAGAGPPPPPAARKSRRVNIDKRFTILAETGRGSMSHVYRAMDNTSGRSICLKVQEKDKSDAAAARASRAGRLTEGEIGMQISHPNVVRTFEHGDTTKGAHYIVMEFIDGMSLQFVRQSRVMGVADKIELLAQAADGLAAIHAAGFIHHDVGPKNVLVDKENRVKWIDFGLAVPNTAAFRRPGNRTGTLQYMAPEVIRRETTDEKLDIFSFGVLMFEFFTNKFPYDAVEPMAQMRQRINSDPIDIDVFVPHLPEGIKGLIRKTLKRAPKDRWPSMSTLGDAMRELPEAS